MPGLPEINENYSRFQDGGWHSARPGSPTRWEIRLKPRIRTESITDWLKRTSHNLQHNCSKRKNTLISNAVSHHPETPAGFTPPPRPVDWAFTDRTCEIQEYLLPSQEQTWGKIYEIKGESQVNSGAKVITNKHTNKNPSICHYLNPHLNYLSGSG